MEKRLRLNPLVQVKVVSYGGGSCGVAGRICSALLSESAMSKTELLCLIVTAVVLAGHLWMPSNS